MNLRKKYNEMHFKKYNEICKEVKAKEFATEKLFTITGLFSYDDYCEENLNESIKGIESEWLDWEEYKNEFTNKYMDHLASTFDYLYFLRQCDMDCLKAKEMFDRNLVVMLEKKKEAFDEYHKTEEAQ